MAGTLSVQTIQGLATAADPTTVSIASGHILHAPGHVINFGSYNTGYGSGARLVTTSTSWQTLNINGTDQATFGSLTKHPSNGNVLAFNKKSSNSQLSIVLNFPSYNTPGGSGHGVRCMISTDQTNYVVSDILTNGPANGWGFHGYGGATAGMNNFTWSTYDNASYRNTINTYTGDFYFYFQVYNWASTDTISYIDHSDTYPKYGTVQVMEVAQ